MPYLEARRARVARALGLRDEILLVGAGEPVPLPENSDQTYPFRAHADYFYLTALECPGGVVAFDPRDGASAGWTSFVPTATEAERVWEGREQPPGTPLAQLDGWLAARAGRAILSFGAPMTRAELTVDPAASAAARARFVHARRAKDATEIELIRRAAGATAHGFAALVAALRPGVTERALQVELECGFARGGGRRPGYGTIVGTGPHAAVLHFDPSPRAARDGEFVLVDAGAEIDRYMADVTRTYVAGRASPFQRDLYAIVLSAEQNAIARCVAGAEWKDVHLAAAVEMVDGLVQLGLLRGSASSLVEQDAHTLFFPHGLGHLVGLGVRDGSGQAPGRAKDPRASLRSLRLDLPLAPGYVVTVEPGLYFIPALLDDPARRARFRDCVNWDAVTPHLALGGVRIEDNVLVTTGAPEVLTAAIPKPVP